MTVDRARPAAEVHWRCFHCDDVFADRRSAALHFGETQDSTPACQIKAGAEGSLLQALRGAEKAAAEAIAMLHDETSDLAKAYHAMVTRHCQALRAAEEDGYERGLADGRALAAQLHDNDHCGAR